ncbi:6-hydroxymethylpterin diphosphokinase MptE-like protein [Thalassotalea fusca]
MQNTLVDIEQYKISQHGEPYLYSVNRDTFEKKNAQVLYTKVFQEKLWKKDHFYVVLGTDGGLLVDYILEHGLPYGSYFIFIDMPHVLASIEAQLAFTKWDDKVTLCTMEEWQVAAEEFKIHAFLYTEKVRYIKSIAALDAYDTRYHDLDTELALTIESLQHKTVVSLSRKPFITRQLENLCENATPLIELKGVFKGKTCVVLAGGPSLDKHIEWVKENRNHLVILAISRIAKKLLQEDLIPHMVFSVDPHEVSFDVSKEMLDFPESVIFVHSNYVVPSLLGQWTGKHYYCDVRAPWSSKLNKENADLQGPTVTNSAISAAVALGFKRVLLTGADLCYAKDGTAYASGSNEAQLGPRLGFKGQWVETYEGSLAETSTSFMHASFILSDQAKAAKEVDCEFINLSENAAKMEHIAHKKTHDIHLDQQFDAVATLSAHVRQNDNLVRDAKVLLSELKRIIKEVNEIYRIAKSALSDNEALYKDYKNEEKNYQFKLKLDKAEKKLTTKFQATNNFVKRFGIKSFIKTVRTDSDQDWTDEEMEEVGRIYYQAYIDTIDDLKPLLVSAKTRIENRIEEHKANPNVKKLMEQWLKDKHYKRAIHWLAQHDNCKAQLTDELKADFNFCENEYKRIIENTDTDHFRRSKAETSIAGLNRKILYLFQKRNTEALEQLANNLVQKLDDEADASWLLSLTKAYLAVLNQDSTKALEFFAEIEENMLTEDEAMQIAALAIETQDIVKATYFMEKLSQLADHHLLRYAAILRLNGERKQSCQVYEQYLENNSQDTNAWLAYGKLAIELNELEIAANAFHQVIAIMPDNGEARNYLEQLAQV